MAATIERFAATADADAIHAVFELDGAVIIEGLLPLDVVDRVGHRNRERYGRRNGEPDSYYWRITQYLFPWFTLIPPFGDHPLGGHMWIPIDDENCWAWSINFLPNQPLTESDRRDMEEGKGIHVDYTP